jgi:signal transduction histidine kinase
MILIVIIFGVLLNISIWSFFHFGSEPRGKFIPPLLLKMNEYLVNDIGFPPDTVKADRLSEYLGLNIRFESKNLNWTSTPSVPTFEELSSAEGFKENSPSRKSFMMEYKERRYYIYNTSMGTYIISAFSTQDFFNTERAIIILVLLVSFILIPLYFILRWLYSPLKDLSDAVEQIADGNYDVNLNVKRKDELGELAKSINQMSARIKDSINAKEHLLLDVSHELRSPLTRLKLGLEVGSPKEKINEDIISMEQMITGLLENYRSESIYDNLKYERTDIAKLLKDAIIEYDCDSRLSFNYPAKKSIFLNIDPLRISTVFRNLIENALKYSTKRVEISIQEKNSNVQVFFKDKGIGIPEKDLKYIFEPFYRSDPSRSRRTGGFGLGLSICKKIMEAHKSLIEVQSKINEGTTVILTFKK